MVYVLGPRDKKRIAELKDSGATVIMTVSTSPILWMRGLSPFFLGPAKLYGGHTAWNVENAWQYSKVYKSHTDEQGNPSASYFEWAKRGWKDRRARRYPMGKGEKPEYLWWDGQRLDYIQARKKVYAPLYIRALAGTDAWNTLKEKYASSEDLILWDFDGYDHRAAGMTYQDVINFPKRPMGHAFILAMLLECRDTVVDMLKK